MTLQDKNLAITADSKADKMYDALTNPEKSFVSCYMETYDIEHAAKESGLPGSPGRLGRTLLRRVAVRSTIAALREEATGCIPFNETDVALLLWRESKNVKNTGTARVAAASKLADVMRLMESPTMPGAKKITAAQRKEKDVDAKRDVKTMAAKKAIENTKGGIQDLTIVMQTFGMNEVTPAKIIQGEVVRVTTED